MAEGSFKRKLTAVFSADVVGYSRLMGEDEAATVRTVEAYKGVTDRHVWAAQYDRGLKDVFAVQDEMARRVAGHVAGTLFWGEASRLSMDTTTNPEAYDLYLRALSLVHFTDKAKNATASQLLERAIALDPRYSHAMALLGTICWDDARRGWVERPEDAFRRAEGLAEQALAIDASNATALQLSARLHSQKGDHKKAIALARRAVEVEPNNYEAQYRWAWQLDLDGQLDEAVEIMTHAMRVWPHPPPWARNLEGFINIHAGALRSGGKNTPATPATSGGGELHQSPNAPGLDLGVDVPGTRGGGAP